MTAILRMLTRLRIGCVCSYDAARLSEDIFLMEFKNGNRLLILLNDGTNIRREVVETSNMNDEKKSGRQASRKLINNRTAILRTWIRLLTSGGP